MRSRSSVPLLFMLAAAVTAAGTLACGDDTSGPADAGFVRFVNNSNDSTVLFLHFRECGTQFYGGDELPFDACPTGCIVPGDTKVFAREAGCWDALTEVVVGPLGPGAENELDSLEFLNIQVTEGDTVTRQIGVQGQQ